MTTPLFHLAFPVDDLDRARAFYSGVLGCREGRSAEHWVDFDFFGHQIVAHLAPADMTPVSTSEVASDQVPVRHFGLILPPEQWQHLLQRLREVEIEFLIEPRTRFAGEAGEQSTLFVSDPAGNALEFKSFANENQIFAH